MERLKHTPPQFTDAKSVDFSFEDALGLAKVRRDEFQEKRPYQSEATIKLDTPFPVVISAIGDIHFGSVYCDTDKFLKDVTSILDTPNAFIVLMSNLIDNGNPSQFPDSMLANSMTPHEQAKAMNDLLKRMDAKHKILGAVTAPCHEGWLWKKMGVDMNELLFADCEFPKLDNGGMLHLNVGKQNYNMALFHQFGPFGSHFNKNHPSQQMQRLVLAGQADIVVLAHSHVGEAMQTYYGVGADRRDVVYLRSGSYKGNVAGKIENTPDMWLKNKSGMDAEPGAQSVILSAQRREMAAFLKPETALKFQEGLLLYSKLAAIGMLGQADKFLRDYEKV
jgi:hypothetical protein